MGQVRTTRRRLAALVAGTAVLAAALTSCSDPLFNVVISNPTMFPVFQTAVTDYVNRCDPDRPTEVEVTAPSGAVVSIAGRRGRRGTFTERVAQRPNERFTIIVTLDGTSTTHHVRCLPEDFPAFDAHGNGDPAQSEFYVTTIIEGFGPNRPVIFDARGVPVWWSEAYPHFLTTPLPNGNLATLAIGGGMLERRLDGTTVRTLDTQGAPSDFHDVLLLPNGNYVLVTADYRPCDLSSWGVGATNCLFHDVQELTPGGEVVWSWQPEEDIPVTETPHRWRDVYNEANDAYDPWHWNSIEWTGDGFIMSFRHQDAVYKVDYATKDVVWKLGGRSRPESLRVIGDPVFDRGSSIAGQHDARLLPDGTLSLYDNRTDSWIRGPRSVRYRIDEGARTARLVGQVSDPIAPTSGCCGSTRVLPGGSYVTGWGGTPWFTEHRADGTQVFRMSANFIYRVIPLLPGEMSRTEIRAGMDAQYDGPALSAAASGGPQLVPPDPAALGDARARLGADI